MVRSYSLDFAKLALQRCLGPFMLTDTVRLLRATGPAIFFLCLLSMLVVISLSKF